MKPMLRQQVEAGAKLETRRVVPTHYKKGEIVFIREEVWAYGHWKPKAKGYRFVIDDTVPVQYAGFDPGNEIADKSGRKGWTKRSPLHCRAVDARTFIVIDGTRMEALGEMNDDDAMTEGIERCFDQDSLDHYYTIPGDTKEYGTPLQAFEALWVSINGVWTHDQLVQVITFHKADQYSAGHAVDSLF